MSKKSDDEISEIICQIKSLLDTSDIRFKLKVFKKPHGLRVIYVFTEEELTILIIKAVTK